MKFIGKSTYLFDSFENGAENSVKATWKSRWGSEWKAFRSNGIDEKVERILLEDLRIAISELALGSPYTSITILKILTKKLDYHKVCGQWIPWIFTGNHKQKRVEGVQQFLQRFEVSKDEFLESIVTGDETIYPRNQATITSTLPKLKKFKQTQSAGKSCKTSFGRGQVSFWSNIFLVEQQ